MNGFFFSSPKYVVCEAERTAYIGWEGNEEILNRLKQIAIDCFCNEAIHIVIDYNKNVKRLKI